MAVAENVAAGTVLSAWEATVTPVRQQKYLSAAEVDPARYGAYVDPSLLAMECFLGLRRARFRLDRVIHEEQRIRIRSSAPLGEPLALEGRVTQVTPSRAGERARVTFEGRRASGASVFTAEA